MNPIEAGALLTAAAQIDNRNWDESTAQAWSAMIDPAVTFRDAIDALKAHYNRTRQWLMPSDINDHVRGLHKIRLQDAGPPDYPNGLTQAQERAYRELWQMHVKSGSPAAEATTLADEQLHIDRGQLGPAPDDIRKSIERFRFKPKRDGEGAA